MTALLTADIHMTENPREQFRWGLFSWLITQSTGVDELIVCGDLTAEKDRHPATLTNQFVQAVRLVASAFKKVILVKGNHDYFSKEHPFFEFLDDNNRIIFVSEPMHMDLSVGSALFVPAGASWEFEVPDTDFVFAHATFSGAKAENGMSLTGVDPACLRKYDGYCYSGDIHVPQKLTKNIEYIGAPYHTRFGDEFTPRCLLLKDDWKTEDLHFPAPRKHVLGVTEPEQLFEERVAEGDHVKVRCYLRRAEMAEWRAYRRRIGDIVAKRGWVQCGVEPIVTEAKVNKKAQDQPESQQMKSGEELLLDYADRNRASDDHIRIGKELLG